MLFFGRLFSQILAGFHLLCSPPTGNFLANLLAWYSHHMSSASEGARSFGCPEEVQPPRRIKDVQRLNGCITALGRFISRLSERALPFFKLLKKKGPVEWTPEAEEAL